MILSELSINLPSIQPAHIGQTNLSKCCFAYISSPASPKKNLQGFFTAYSTEGQFLNLAFRIIHKLAQICFPKSQPTVPNLYPTLQKQKL